MVRILLTGYSSRSSVIIGLNFQQIGKNPGFSSRPVIFRKNPGVSPTSRGNPGFAFGPEKFVGSRRLGYIYICYPLKVITRFFSSMYVCSSNTILTSFVHAWFRNPCTKTERISTLKAGGQLAFWTIHPSLGNFWPCLPTWSSQMVGLYKAKKHMLKELRLKINPAYDPNSKDTWNRQSFCFGTHGTCFLAQDPLSTVLVAKLQGWKRNTKAPTVAVDGTCFLQRNTVKHEELPKDVGNKFRTYDTSTWCNYIPAGSLWKIQFDAPKKRSNLKDSSLNF